MKAGRRWRLAALPALAVLAAAVALAWHGDPLWARDATPLPASANSVPQLGFTPPPAGSYRLEHILHVPDGRVLDSDGSVHRLRDFTTGRITLFSLIYTYCTDAKGCPLAYATLHSLKDMLAGVPALRGQVRFVSMSFDPQFDTPAMMRIYGGADADADADASAAAAPPWFFLTTAAAADLAPILDGFGQDVAVIARGAVGQRAPVLAHLLNVYLIDRRGLVREIYATAYLHPEVICNDIVTLLLEERSAPPSPFACGPSAPRQS